MNCEQFGGGECIWPQLSWTTFMADRPSLQISPVCKSARTIIVCMLRAGPTLPQNIWSYVSILERFHVHNEDSLEQLYIKLLEVGKNKPQLVTDRKNLRGTPVKI